MRPLLKPSVGLATDLKNRHMVKNKKLIWQIFPSFLIITLLSVAAVTSYSTNYFKKFFLNNSEEELTIRAKLLQKNFGQLLKSGENQYPYIDAQCKDIGKSTGTRVTIILPSGKVIGDSFGDIAAMENHMRRPEIKAALKKEKGVSMRYSSTLDKNMMYIALPVLYEGTVVAVARTSVSVTAIDREINRVRNKILIAMFFIILVAAAASLLVTRRITHPIEQMKTGALEFAAGNLGERLAVPASEELSELAITMNRMAGNLDEKIRDFKNRSMELEAVHSSMQEGVIAIDENQKIITINDAAANIFNFSAANLKSKYILEVARNVEFQKFIQRALATHEPVEDDILISRDQDLVLNIHSTALYDISEKRMGTLIIFHDITRIRRLEIMHKDFAANVSHELKTPLTAIKGFIETLQEMVLKNDTQQSATFLKIIEKNVNRMVDLINDLLALAKLERLKGTNTQFESQNISYLIQNAVNMCNENIVQKEIFVNIDCDEAIRIKVDSGLMEQAIINLIDNAIKYSHKKALITIEVVQKETFVDIAIEDNGSGIDQEHLPKIFNRFYRVDKARSRNEGGTGLGLAIVKHIAQYHKGKIEVKSIKDKGSCFTLSLPV